MKNTLYIYIGLILSCLTGCEGIDNYSQPDQTYSGSIINTNTNKPLEIDPGGVNLRMEELSWDENAQPFSFNAKIDGTFMNSKIFAGTYRLDVWGPFVPFYQTDKLGNVVVDNRKTMDINKGINNIDWLVEPMLEIEWVGDPIVNADKTITANVKITRGTTNPAYQQEMKTVYLLINSLSTVGTADKEDTYSVTKTVKNNILGTTYSITSKGGAVNLHNIKKWYIRVGARTGYELNRYNMSSVKEVIIP
jgi:hypothetical protein